ncbi:IS1182 family transposase [Sediminibacterium sp.]|uniref:IS1182 family transposase n=1 Tax=Sediminibacterium sp. TaxID=1917865 RepID=UPI0014504DB2|nr:IS1182 family transposase [Sediminibacterium sp.]KAF0144390.1 MAG: transposase IS4 family protein [Ignavibacteria bacterium]MDP3180389.1 IS1182 family transposase [Bacteroidota bacterium]MDP3566405.1 IS1182 family transposase [Sediminibacterium sp.]
MKKFIGADREQRMLMPFDLGDWLPENHLARFVVDVVDKLDMRGIYNQYKGVGSTAYDPRMLLSLLFYGYSTGVFSSRKIESSTFDSVAFRFVAGNHHPDHDTISEFRKRFLGQIKGWFKEILLIGKELGLIKLGNIYIDGTKVQANASRHKAMSYEYIQKLEKQLEEEIEKLLDLAASKDEIEKGSELDIPEELKLRKNRLSKIQEAKRVVEQRASERYQKEKEEYDAKMEQRNQKKEKTGKNSRGKEPKAPSDEPNDKDQYNFTDPESRIMKTSRGFDQCYNSQAAVNDDMIIVGAYSNSHANDKQEFIPAIESVPEGLSGEISTAVADTGYFSEKNIDECKQMNIEPIISTSREKHNSFLSNILNPDPMQDGPFVTPVEKMTQKLKSEEGKEIYKKRKQTVEPVFGVIKEILGFRRFSLRGEAETDAEWSLVCSAYNLKRFFKMQMA